MMLMPGKRKRIASLIVANMAPDYVGKEDGGYNKEFSNDDFKEESDDENYGVVAVCEKVIDCVKSGDAKGMAGYMEDLVEMLKGSD